MILTDVSDTIHADCWLCFCLTRAIIARRCHQARNVEHFDFDLTCDVTRDPEVNKICFPSTSFSQVFQMPFEFLESAQ